MTTGMEDAVLIVMSGKVLGFGVTNWLLMLTTRADARPAVGSRSGSGVDCPDGPAGVDPLKAMLADSRRMTPLPPRLGWPDCRFPPLTSNVPPPAIVGETSRIAPPLPLPPAPSPELPPSPPFARIAPSMVIL